MENTAIVKLVTEKTNYLVFNQEALELLDVDQPGSLLAIGVIERVVNEKTGKAKKEIFVIKTAKSLLEDKDLMKSIAEDYPVKDNYLKQIILNDDRTEGHVEIDAEAVTFITELATIAKSDELIFKLLPCFKYSPILKSVKDNFNLSDSVAQLMHISAKATTIGKEDVSKSQACMTEKIQINPDLKSKPLMPSEGFVISNTDPIAAIEEIMEEDMDHEEDDDF